MRLLEGFSSIGTLVYLAAKSQAGRRALTAFALLLSRFPQGGILAWIVAGPSGPWRRERALAPDDPQKWP